MSAMSAFIMMMRVIITIIYSLFHELKMVAEDEGQQEETIFVYVYIVLCICIRNI